MLVECRLDGENHHAVHSWTVDMADPVSTMAVIGTEMELSDKIAWILMLEGQVFKVLIVTYLTDALLHFLRHTAKNGVDVCRRCKFC